MNQKRPGIIRRRYLWFLAVLVAVAAGFYFHWPPPPLQETDLLIPINVKNTPAGLIVTGSPVKGIEVRVRGTSENIDSLSNRKMNYTLDLFNADSGINTIPVEARLISLPKEIKLVKINTESLTVNLKKEITRQLPVLIVLEGKPATGFEIVSAKTNPPAVILRGPEDTLLSLENIKTKPVDVSGMSESIKKEIAFNLPEHIEVIYPSGTMRAEMVIKEKIVIRKIEAIPVIGQNCGYDYRINPPAISVEINGPMNTLEKLVSEKGVTAFVDLKDLKPGVYPRRAVISLPPKTALVSATPELFTVEIFKAPASKKKTDSQ